MKVRKLFSLVSVLVIVMLLIPSTLAGAALAAPVSASVQPNCSLLDNPKVRGLMSGMFETYLLNACGRQSELGKVPSSEAQPTTQPGAPFLGADVPVNDPSGDAGATSHTQSETSISVNQNTGTVCSAYNDSFHYLTQGYSFSGFSRSTDGGATFQDRAGFPSGGGGVSFGDPSVVWRKADGLFYYTSLHSNGLGFWKSTDDCNTFTYVGMVHTGGNDDKELMAIDNNPTSPYYGRIYVAWINFNDSRIYSTSTDNNGGSWSAPVALSASGADVQGAWPTIAPNGDVYVGWLYWAVYPTGPIDIQISRSTNGGASFTPVTSPLTNAINPRAAGPTGNCGRPALNGNIRYLPSPQLTFSPNGDLHVVYSYDPDGYNTGDVVNVYYRRSTDHGATWQSEFRLNDDTTLNDQYYPTISAGPTGRLMATWYDRRLDAGNLLYDYYMRVSPDGGVTWQPSVRVSDVSSPVYIDPNLASCYHGDYDQQTQDAAKGYIQWSSDVNFQDGHFDPDVWFDSQIFNPDFALEAAPLTQSVCAPAPALYDVTVGQLAGFSQNVTLTAHGAPAGSTVEFNPNPVTPPGTSALTVANTISATAGTYSLDIVGTAVTLVHTTTVGLELFTALPGDLALLTPASEATNQPVRPTFTWSASQGKAYDLQVATDAEFTNVVVSAAGITQTQYTPAAALAFNTVYYWRVRAHNTCGDSAYAAASRFLTEPTVGQCSLGTTPNTLLSQGFEAGLGDWTAGGTGASTWALNTSRKHSGSYAIKASDIATASDQWLTSPAFLLPADQSLFTLQYYDYRRLQTGGCFDGGLLEVSTNGGATWTQVMNPDLLTGPYDGLISDSNGNPLAGRDAWCQAKSSWVEPNIVSLEAYAGQTVNLRLRFGTDNSVGFEGWYVDDIAVQSCVPSMALAPDAPLRGAPGETVTHTFILTNASQATDTYALALTGNTWASAIVSPNPVTVASGGHVEVKVRVTVPADFVALDDTFSLKATSASIPGLEVSAQGKTQVAITPGVSVQPVGQEQNAAPGAVVTYTFTVNNTGDFTDTFALGVTGVWTATLPGGLTTGPLAPGASKTVTVVVIVPLDAVEGASDVTTLTATSGWIDTVKAEATATTHIATTFQVFLPVVLKH